MFKNIIKKFFSVPAAAVKLARSSSGEFLLKKTDFGLVRIDFAVVEKIAKRALNSVKGVKESELVVEKFSEANPMKIRLTVALLEGYSAPRISEAVDKAINAELRENVQLEFYVPVDVKVKEIAQVIVPKKRRVR